ncbi:MAG: galactokinase [Gammaproteobacteria bacterium]|jgi:galactokinase
MVAVLQSARAAKQVGSLYFHGVSETRRVHAPGRVNLIGEHTDYTGGLVFPLAIDRGITLTYTTTDDSIELTSNDVAGQINIPVPVTGSANEVTPDWGTYVAAMAIELGTTTGLRGHLVSDIPAGAGLSSSAALECAVGLSLDFQGTPLELSQIAQRAEHAATGVPTGIMDQLAIAAGVPGHAMLIDCHSLDVTPHLIPDDIDIVVKFIANRRLVGSAYAERVAECARAEDDIGPLRLASPDDVARVVDPIAQQRARHVISENLRVIEFAAALAAGNYVAAGQIMVEGHASLRDNFDTSTDEMDAAVGALNALPGVFGTRMTGGGFGGCIVAICEPGAIADGWAVKASAGARHIA